MGNEDNSVRGEGRERKETRRGSRRREKTTTTKVPETELKEHGLPSGSADATSPLMAQGSGGSWKSARIGNVRGKRKRV